jgi:hypothetical protein
VPRLLLQPIPRSGQELEHPGFLDRQHGLPVCEGGVVEFMRSHENSMGSSICRLGWTRIWSTTVTGAPFCSIPQYSHQDLHTGG